MTEFHLEKAQESQSQEDSEAALVGEAQRDPAAFTALYRRYVDAVYFYMLSKVGERQAAEDLTEQVFLDALQGLPKYRHQGAFTAWLFTIARRRAADYHRQQTREKRVFAGSPGIQAGERVDPAQNVEAQLEQSDRRARLLSLLNQLEEHEIELLRLRFASGLRFFEIADLLERKESAVKMAIYRLLDRLKRKLEAQDG
jgi:RNA polymerase sigma-70 factor (ECF subfamily)